MGETGTSGTAGTSGTVTGTEEPSSEMVLSSEVTAGMSGAGPTVGTPGKETTAGQSRKTNGGIIRFEFSLN